MSDEQALRAELERVRKERDDYKEALRDVLKRQFAIDLDELEADLRSWKENGGIPFSRVRDMLETEFGIKL
jgi:hypothetical protein